MKFTKIIARRLAEFAFLMAVELATTFVLNQLTGGYVLLDIVALLVATVVFDALAQKWDKRSAAPEESQQPSNKVVRRMSIVRFRSIRAKATTKPRPQ